MKSKTITMLNSETSFTSLTKLEYALIHSSWEPTVGAIAWEIDSDRRKNPYNYPNLPKKRSEWEVVRDLKIEYWKQYLNI